MMVDKKLIETYNFKVCEKHPKLVWANIDRWSSECPLCELESDWQYEYDNLEKLCDETKTDLEESQERVEELENAVDEAHNSLDDITRTLNRV
ncbi:MAG: hypothetical protein KAJ19_26185 [Gammaproteobacteria bacterium]|nr:hypothetical protein [Gammaproteobacteria bacterium]